ncbi:MAG: FtsH protease activity modulator HflK [Rhodanobacteraceae bacterium]
MPWKEPGDKKPREPRGRGPWGQDGHGGGGPDFEAWLRKGRRRMGPFGHGPFGVLAIIALLIVLWLLFGGWTMVGNNQVGVVLRFGRLQALLQPGFHLRYPSPIDRVHKLDMARTRTISDATRLMTSDGQLAMVDYYVQYKIADARKFLFATRDAKDAARNAAAITARNVVGTHTLRQLMDRNDDQLGKTVAARLRDALARENLGIQITDAGIQRVGVPSEVKQAFDDIATAHEDAKAAQATATANVANGKVQADAQAASIKANAKAYHDKAISDAQAGVARFGQLLVQYQAAPAVTKHRLWLDTMQDVLSRNHVVVNSGSGNVIVQFPLHPAGTPAPAGSSAPASAASASAPVGSTSVPVTSGPAMRGSGA